VAEEVSNLLAQGMSPEEIRSELEKKGYVGADIALAISGRKNKSDDDKRNSRLLSIREVFDRIGYGATTPQFVNVLFWLSGQASGFILLLIGLLNGFKTLLGVFFSNLLQEYQRLHDVKKNMISTAGIIFGFSFLVMALALRIGSMTLFSIAFLVGAIGVVAYGDLYQHFVYNIIRKERMSTLLRKVAHWGVLITAISLLISGYLLDKFPMTGASFSLFGYHITNTMTGYLLIFEITAFSFILAGYVTSLLADTKNTHSYSFAVFFKEHHQRMKQKLSVYWTNKYVMLLTLASIVSGLLQIMIAAYSGIAIYKIVQPQYTTPFFILAIMYAIAIIASFTGPFFTQKIHKSIGLAPTLVFGTLLTAILPLVLVFNTNIAAIAAGLVVYVIGSAITGFGQGLLAKKLLSDELRRDYFQAQSYVVIIPYIIMIPILSWVANAFPLSITFLVVAIGFVLVVMPLYFILVLISQNMKL